MPHCLCPVDFNPNILLLIHTLFCSSQPLLFRFVSAWTASSTSGGALVPLVPRAPAAGLYLYPPPPARSSVYPSPAAPAPPLPSNGSVPATDSELSEPLLLVCQQRTAPGEHFKVQKLSLAL